jgi:L-fuconolactonase
MMRRRNFLAGTAATLIASRPALAQSASVDGIPIIDSHIHLFDGTRPIGAEYTGSRDYSQISKVSLPLMYAPQAAQTGVVGAIVIQSSKWLEENLWYLEICNANPFMVGVCGYLDTGMPDFGQYVERYHRDPLYRAIRFSSFYAANGGKVALLPAHVENLKILAQADMVLETQTPTIDLMTANCLAADAVPGLRIIMDHLPSFDPTPDNQKAYEAVVKEMAARPNIFVKLTEVYHPQRSKDRLVVRDYGLLKARLDFLYDIYGEDRVIFGTDYPNSYGVATIPEEVGLVKQFFATKSRQAAEKYFWKNSQRVYKWAKRTPAQPSLT